MGEPQPVGWDAAKRNPNPQPMKAAMAESQPMALCKRAYCQMTTMTTISDIEKCARLGFLPSDAVPEQLLTEFEYPILGNKDKLTKLFKSDMQWIALNSIRLDPSEVAWCISESQYIDRCFELKPCYAYASFLYMLAHGISEVCEDKIHIAAAAFVKMIIMNKDNNKIFADIDGVLSTIISCCLFLIEQNKMKGASFYFIIIAIVISVHLNKDLDCRINEFLDEIDVKKRFCGVSDNPIYFGYQFESILDDDLNEAATALDLWLCFASKLNFKRKNDYDKFFSVIMP